MRLFKSVLLFIFLTSCGQFVSAPDSLKISRDSNSVNQLIKKGNALSLEDNYPGAIDYFNQALKIAREINSENKEGQCLKRLGDLYFAIDEYERAREYYNQSIRKFKSQGPGYYLANAYNNLGNLEEAVGDYNAALKSYFASVDNANPKLNQKDIANAYNNIAIVYSDIGDFKKELAYNYKALKIREQLNDLNGLSASYNNIGVTYQSLENYPNSITHFSKSLEIRKQLNDAHGVAQCYHNLAISHKQMGNYKEAAEWYSRALHIQDSLNLKHEAALTLINMGRLFNGTRNYKKALEVTTKALSIADELRDFPQRTDAHEALHEIYAAMKNHELAFLHFRKYIELRDSLNNVEQTKEFTRIEMQNQFDKELSARQAEQEKKDQLIKQEKKQQRIIIISVSAVAAVILFFLLLVYKNFRQKQAANLIISNQKKEVEEQKHVIEEKQKEIIDSINYAKRIQSAILASEESIRSVLPESFLLYKPKDIVAGDFYFFETTPTHLFYAAADCTGHGVPGALVSVVCANALTRCVNEFALSDPGKILDKTRELVVETFRKSSDSVKDGMDISILSINRDEKNKQTKTIKWAGANNPLWIIKERHTESGEVDLVEIKANKQPIGLTESPAPFTTHEIVLNEHDHVYLFTDGYADQFGGPNGKKFKYRQLAEVLKKGSMMNPHEQKLFVENAFESWKSENEQVDDVLLIGIKF